MPGFVPGIHGYFFSTAELAGSAALRGPRFEDFQILATPAIVLAPEAVEDNKRLRARS